MSQTSTLLSPSMTNEASKAPRGETGQSQPGNNHESLSVQATGAEYALLAAIRKDLGVPDESEGTQ
jgi:hypothetical protein